MKMITDELLILEDYMTNITEQHNETCSYVASTTSDDIVHIKPGWNSQHFPVTADFLMFNYMCTITAE